VRQTHVNDCRVRLAVRPVDKRQHDLAIGNDADGDGIR